jgi:hypothetical protein
MRNSPSGELDLRVTLWPSGPYLIALSTRARIACSTRAGSTLTSPFYASVVSRAAPCSAASDPALREPPEQNARLHGLHAEGRRRRLRAREEQQIFDHASHGRRLPDNLLQELLVLTSAVELEPDLRVAPDHGEGRPEFVGDFGEKVGLGACSVGEHALHALPLADVARGRL